MIGRIINPRPHYCVILNFSLRRAMPSIREVLAHKGYIPTFVPPREREKREKVFTFGEQGKLGRGGEEEEEEEKEKEKEKGVFLAMRKA